MLIDELTYPTKPAHIAEAIQPLALLARRHHQAAVLVNPHHLDADPQQRRRCADPHHGHLRVWGIAASPPSRSWAHSHLLAGVALCRMRMAAALGPHWYVSCQWTLKRMPQDTGAVKNTFRSAGSPCLTASAGITDRRPRLCERTQRASVEAGSDAAARGILCVDESNRG